MKDYFQSILHALCFFMVAILIAIGIHRLDQEQNIVADHAAVTVERCKQAIADAQATADRKQAVKDSIYQAVHGVPPDTMNLPPIVISAKGR